MKKPPRARRRTGRKIPNIYDVARMARVSVFTVSAVTNKSGHVSVALKRRVETAILLGFIFRPAHHLGEKGVGDVGNDHSDGVGLALGQAARQQVGAVVQLPDGGFDAP